MIILLKKNQDLYSILGDMGVKKKTDITIEQLVAKVSSVRKELRKNLSARKVSSIFQSLNTIVVHVSPIWYPHVFLIARG